MAEQSLAQLREDVERQELLLRKRTLETAQAFMPDYVSPAEPLFDSPDFFYPINGENLPYNLDNRLKGELLPVYITEYGLKVLRDYSRWLAAFNTFAINALENRVSYVVGKGFGYQAVAAAGDESDSPTGDKELCRAAQRVIDRFMERTDWGEVEQELMRSADVDGEAFLRFFHTGGGECTVRRVEPEHVRSPGDQSPKFSFGIETPPHDIQDALAVWVVEDPAVSWTPSRVPADEIVHVKLNVNRTAKRGYPTLVPVRKNLQRADKLLQNMSTLAQVQATFALIRKHKQYSASAVSTWQQGQADLAIGDPLTGKTRYQQRYQPGTILDVPENTDYEFPSANIPADSMVAVLQAELRAVAARLVMPEYMLTSNAENANYSSTLVAEAPAVKHFERLQSFLGRHLGDGRYGGPGRCGAMWRVLECAVDFGGLPAAVLDRVVIQVEGPSLVARDKSQETTRAQTLNQAGVLSKATWAKWEGLNRKEEQAQLEQEREAEPPPPGEEPPPDGGEPPPDTPANDGGDFGPEQLDGMAGGVRDWLADSYALSGEEAPDFDDEAIHAALKQSAAEVGEACVANKGGKGHHDDETGAPCKTGVADKARELPGKVAAAGKAVSDAFARRHAAAAGNKAEKILKAGAGLAGAGAAHLAQKARQMAVDKFKAMEAEYGRAGAIVIMSAVVAMLPVPVPGSAIAPVLAAKGIKAVLGRVRRSGPALAAEGVEWEDGVADLLEGLGFFEDFVRGKDSRGRWYCRRDGTPVPCGDRGKGPATSRARGSGRGWADRPADKADVERQEQSANAYKKKHAETINARTDRTPEERVKLIRQMVRDGRDSGVPKWAANEAILAVVTNSKLSSHGSHVWDMEPTRAGGKDVQEDAKSSKGAAAYYDKSDTKIGKARDLLKNPRVVRAMLALSKGNGLYLHVGVDPKSTSPTLAGRGVVEPWELGKRVDGSGGVLPFVKLSGKVDDVDAWGKITPADVQDIERRRNAAYRSINVDKGIEHFKAQGEAVVNRTIKIGAEANPELSARAGLEALGLPKDRIDAILAEAKGVKA